MAKDQESTRFSGPSDAIDFEKLEKETQKILYLGLMVAVSFHAALGSYFMYIKTEVRVIRPPTMELVIRRPRMTKPFEFKKKRIKQREYKRKEIVQRRPTREIRTKSIDAEIMGTVVSYELETNMEIDTSAEVFIPEAIDIEMTATREPEKQISMKEELISIDDLDTGQYKAMVIQDPNNKQNIKGFVYISTLWGAELEPEFKRGVIELSNAVNRYTNINSKVDNHVFIDSRKLFNTPFVYLCVLERFELTKIEARNLGEYLRRGGFAVFENGQPQDEFGPGEASLRQAFKDALGKDAKFLPIPNSHPLYHCFFDFDDGPPLGGEKLLSWVTRGRPGRNSTTGSGVRVAMSKQVMFLDGIWLDDRLVAVYSNKAYGKKWADTSRNNAPQLKMGVNMVVFALTQEGSLAQQKMEIYTAVQ